MNAEWKKFTGSDEQIAEIYEMKTGFLYRNRSGVQSDNPCNAIYFISKEHLKNHLSNVDTTHILICNPHPNADMICQQARTGQPVWIKTPSKRKKDAFDVYKSNYPNWNSPGSVYSFTPFED